MCDCHPRTLEQLEAIRVTSAEPNTRADWNDLHNVLEAYLIRRAARHVKAHILSPPGDKTE